MSTVDLYVAVGGTCSGKSLRRSVGSVFGNISGDGAIAPRCVALSLCRLIGQNEGMISFVHGKSFHNGRISCREKITVVRTLSDWFEDAHCYSVRLQNQAMRLLARHLYLSILQLDDTGISDTR